MHNYIHQIENGVTMRKTASSPDLSPMDRPLTDAPVQSDEMLRMLMVPRAIATESRSADNLAGERCTLRV